jgi:hypothetical protein
MTRSLSLTERIKRLYGEFRTWSPEQRRALRRFPSRAEFRKRAARPDDNPGTIVAFFTRDSLYEKEAQRLIRSAELLNLPIHAVAVDSAGSWVRNAGLKPGVLVNLRRELRGPLLYLDVDAVIHRNPWPDLLSAYADADMAVYYDKDDQLISATILICDTDAAMDALNIWESGCKAEPEKWDQMVLQEIIASNAVAIRSSHLPVAYCWIFDSEGNEGDEVFIEQLQASREVNKKTGRFGVSNFLARRKDRVKEIEKVLFER